MAILNLSRWPTVLVFLLAGVDATVFAFVTVNLFSEAMANLHFVTKFGSEAVRHGALVQAAQLGLWGGLALACWLLFKICESELVGRYFRWSRPQMVVRPDASEMERGSGPTPRA